MMPRGMGWILLGLAVATVHLLLTLASCVLERTHDGPATSGTLYVDGRVQ